MYKQYERVEWKACTGLLSAAVIICTFHLISILKSNYRMRKIVNSEQIDHCRDNGSDRELHRLLEAPAARFNIILLVIIVILKSASRVHDRAFACFETPPANSSLKFANPGCPREHSSTSYSNCCLLKVRPYIFRRNVIGCLMKYSLTWVKEVIKIIQIKN